MRAEPQHGSFLLHQVRYPRQSSLKAQGSEFLETSKPSGVRGCSFISCRRLWGQQEVLHKAHIRNDSRDAIYKQLSDMMSGVRYHMSFKVPL